MDFKARNRLINRFIDWEARYNVQDWKINGIDLWPIMKMRIFNHQLHSAKAGEESIRKVSGSNRLVALITDAIKAMAKLLAVRIQPSEYLFSGGDGHRVLDKNKISVNRYFDPMMDLIQHDGKSVILFEYDRIRTKSLYKADRVISAYELFPFYLMTEVLFAKKRVSALSGLPALLNELEEMGINSKSLVNTLKRQTIRIHAWKSLFLFLLKRTGSKKAMALCYYANPMYGLMLASKQIGIDSYDMQHGTQGRMHPAYTFSKVPEGGFNILPRYFYCWDNASYDNIMSWKGAHEPILFGNPWHEYLKENQDKFSDVNLPYDKKRIVVTLQELKPAIENNVLLSVIQQTRSKYSWWLRLHPRISQSEKDLFILTFRKYDLIDNVILEDSRSIPLPLLLIQSKLHISRYSGSISEAALVNVKTIIIDEIGLASYEDLLVSGMAVNGVDKSIEEFTELLEDMITKPVEA